MKGWALDIDEIDYRFSSILLGVCCQSFMIANANMIYCKSLLFIRANKKILNGGMHIVYYILESSEVKTNFLLFFTRIVTKLTEDLTNFLVVRKSRNSYYKYKYDDLLQNFLKFHPV